jgi:hypothetical protein
MPERNHPRECESRIQRPAVGGGRMFRRIGGERRRPRSARLYSYFGAWEEASASCAARLAAFCCEVLGFVELEQVEGSIDVNPTGCDQDAELARLLAAGARPADIGQRDDEGWHADSPAQSGPDNSVRPRRTLRLARTRARNGFRCGEFEGARTARSRRTPGRARRGGDPGQLGADRQGAAAQGTWISARPADYPDPPITQRTQGV